MKVCALESAGGAGADPARTALAWGFCATVTFLVLAERFGELLPVLAAFAGAAWVFTLRSASVRRP